MIATTVSTLAGDYDAFAPHYDAFTSGSDYDRTSMAGGPLARGLLTGKYIHGGDGCRLEPDDRRFSERNLAIVRELVAVAAELDAAPAAVALAWLRAQTGAPIPVMGPRTAPSSRISSALSTWSCRQTDSSGLDRVSAPSLG